MVTITIALVSVAPNGERFFDVLKDSGITVLTIARVVQWIITPTLADHLLAHNWDYVIVLATGAALPDTIVSFCSNVYSVRIKETDDFVSKFKANNPSFIYPDHRPPPLFNLDKPLIATCAQRVELTPALLAFARSELCPKGPVSMLNFISFRPFLSARKSYSEYIEAFKAGIGSKRGGLVKIIGNTAEEGEWDEAVLAQYSSLEHFADMLADPEYQEINKELRLPALRDTCILMTTEVELSWAVEHAVEP